LLWLCPCWGLLLLLLLWLGCCRSCCCSTPCCCCSCCPAFLLVGYLLCCDGMPPAGLEAHSRVLYVQPLQPAEAPAVAGQGTEQGVEGGSVVSACFTCVVVLVWWFSRCMYVCRVGEQLSAGPGERERGGARGTCWYLHGG
jgi:hypothetical protein